MTFLVTLGNGYIAPNGEVHETDTLDYIACCDQACGHKALTDCGFDVDFREGVAGIATGEPVVYTNGQQVDDLVATASYGYYPCFDSPYDTYCICGTQTAEGYEKE